MSALDKILNAVGNDAAQHPSASVGTEAGAEEQHPTDAGTDEQLSPEEYAERLALALVARGFSTTKEASRCPPRAALLTPGIYSATVRKSDEESCRIAVRYVGPDGVDSHIVPMPRPVMFRQLLRSAERHSGRCQLIIRRDGLAGLWPMEFDTHEGLLGREPPE